ncbi:hypothetical protein [Ralstonia phage RP13]|nr:hypothetical protein [Ralstonia phage RP13]
MSDNQKVENIASNELVGALREAATFKHENHFHSLVNFLTSNLQNSIHTREWYFNELQNYRNNYIVNGIYDIVSNDVFVDNGSQDFLTIKCDKHEDVEKELNKMVRRLNLPNVLLSIMPELLHYGSYSIRPVVKENVGVIDLVDDLDSRQVIALTDSKGMPLMYFVANQLPLRSDLSGVGQPYQQQANSTKKSYEYLSITELLHFTLDLNFSRLVLPERDVKAIKQKAPGLVKKLLPSTLKVKTSQSLIWPALDKLKEVLLLDKLSVYRDIGSILTPNLVGVPVPDVYDPNQLIEIVKKYDELLNSNVVKLNNTQNMEITLQELSAVKVVPIVGDRSNPTPIDVGRSAPISSNEALNDGIGRLLNSIGIPKELFDGSEDSKTNMKTNIRYAKKIKRIQKNITKTVQMLCLMHISEKFPHLNIYPEDLHIQLKNNTNVDELENMEAQDLMVSSITSIKSLVNELEDLVAKSSYEIDVDEVVGNIVENFSSLGSKYQGMFKKKEKKQEPSVYTNEQGDTFTPTPQAGMDTIETDKEKDHENEQGRQSSQADGSDQRVPEQGQEGTDH